MIKRTSNEVVFHISDQPVSLTTVANLPPVSTTPVILEAKYAAGVIDTGGKFATC